MSNNLDFALVNLFDGENMAELKFERNIASISSFVTGLIAHTCVEATVRYAFELGYEVTMVRDATADYSACTPAKP